MWGNEIKVLWFPDSYRAQNASGEEKREKSRYIYFIYFEIQINSDFASFFKLQYLLVSFFSQMIYILNIFNYIRLEFYFDGAHNEEK